MFMDARVYVAPGVRERVDIIYIVESNMLGLRLRTVRNLLRRKVSEARP